MKLMNVNESLQVSSKRYLLIRKAMFKYVNLVHFVYGIYVDNTNYNNVYAIQIHKFLRSTY